jgi:hypothetical protein
VAAVSGCERVGQAVPPDGADEPPVEHEVRRLLGRRDVALELADERGAIVWVLVGQGVEVAHQQVRTRS